MIISWYPDMLVLKTTSPNLSPAAPKDLPLNVVPSSRASIAFIFLIKGRFYRFSNAALINSLNKGCAESGLDLNSGWNWTAIK